MVGANPLDRMAAEIRVDGWLTESPEHHLRPKLDRWLGRHPSGICSRAPSPRKAGGRSGRAGEMAATARSEICGQPRSGFFGSFAESTTFIRQTEVDGVVSFEVATGQPGDPAGFAAHGHLVRLMVERG